MRRLILAFILACCASVSTRADETLPVKTIVEGRFTVSSPSGQGSVPLHVSADWTRPRPEVTRAVVVVHGALRNAESALRAARSARTAAGADEAHTLLIVPQFLTQPDVAGHGLGSEMLRWKPSGWKDGDAALAPAGLSSFDVFDALLARLADRALFPALRDVVLAGHSAGAQAVQRYAVAGRGESLLTTVGISLRYVVANPSSYLWFGDMLPRPRPDCSAIGQWKYGTANPPPYVGPTEGMEARYIRRDVVYLLGDRDNDPNHPMLDRSCAAAAQGENRFNRGMQYLFYLENRHPNLVRHRIYAIPGIGHDAAGMFASVCGAAALFGAPGCPGL